MTHNNYIYIAVMALVSYAIRILPLTLIRKPIKNRFVQSFLYYVPYVTLAVMTFPAIVQATQSPVAGAVALVIGIAAAFVAYSFIGQYFFTTKPDYNVAVVAPYYLPDDTVTALQEQLARYGEDLNGDGRVAVHLEQYASNTEADPGAAMAAQARLMADIVACESYFFLLEDPETFQREHGTLRRLDGSLPEEGDDSAGGTCLVWERCPVLAELDLGRYAYSVMGQTATGDSGQLVSGLFIARRGFWTEKTAAYSQGCDALWAKITEGAIS